ncbi:UNVERIFIED_CONTAM: hypothetical protein K2H54_060375 [Gekko kuhli]
MLHTQTCRPRTPGTGPVELQSPHSFPAHLNWAGLPSQQIQASICKAEDLGADAASKPHRDISKGKTVSSRYPGNNRSTPGEVKLTGSFWWCGMFWALRRALGKTGRVPGSELPGGYLAAAQQARRCPLALEERAGKVTAKVTSPVNVKSAGGTAHGRQCRPFQFPKEKRRGARWRSREEFGSEKEELAGIEERSRSEDPPPVAEKRFSLGRGFARSRRRRSPSKVRRGCGFARDGSEPPLEELA